jgi:hypothetical protein
MFFVLMSIIFFNSKQMSHNHKKARTSQDYDGEEDNDAVVSTSATTTVLPPSVHSVPMSAAAVGSAAGVAGIAGRAIPVSASAGSPAVSSYTTLAAPAPAPTPSPSSATTAATAAAAAAAAGVTSASSSSAAAAKSKPPSGVGYGFGSPAGMLNPANQARSSGSAASILGNVRETLSNAWSGAGGGSATKPPAASIPGSGSATKGALSGAEQRAEADGVHHMAATSTPASGLAPVAAASSSAASRARYIPSASAWNSSAIKREAQSQSQSQSHHSPAATVSAGPKSNQGQQHSSGSRYIPPSFDDEVIEVVDSDSD